MADDADAATNVEELQRRLALDAARRAIAVQRGTGRDDCEDCGDDIPKQRQKLVPGATRCAPCQGIHEHTHWTGL